MKGFVFLACAASLATPAAAQDRACRDVRALLNVEGADFRAVTFTLDPRAGVRPLVEGRHVRLPAASDCDLDVTAGRSIGFTCRWEPETSAEARALYDRVIGQINSCLARPVRASPPYTGTGVNILKIHRGNFISRARETHMDLTLYEHVATGPDTPGGPQPIRHVVELAVDLDLQNVVEPEETEDESGG